MLGVTHLHAILQRWQNLHPVSGSALLLARVLQHLLRLQPLSEWAALQLHLLVAPQRLLHLQLFSERAALHLHLLAVLQRLPELLPDLHLSSEWCALLLLLVPQHWLQPVLH